MFIPFYSCLPPFTHVNLCSSIFIDVFLCISLFARVYLSMFAHDYSCQPITTLV